MPSDLAPIQQAAAFHGLATNASLPTGERLQCALQALDLYESGVESLRGQAAADALRSAAAKLDALPSCGTYPDCTAGEEPHDRHETPGATLLRWADEIEGDPTP